MPPRPPTLGRRTHANLPQQPLPLSISDGHQRRAAKQAAAAGEGRGGSRAADPPPGRLSDGKVIFTIQALRPALLISYMCPFRRWGRFWGRGCRPSWRRPASPIPVRANPVCVWPSDRNCCQENLFHFRLKADFTSISETVIVICALTVSAPLDWNPSDPGNP
ncbi:hypothetical protein HJG60_010544 [Phyllostomus discolor]|uniref:Uncharacterized protein n=1 Tax=Phyllostomus discolor TaxID=89673 RepID=A0A834ALI4_9CHIR|nr:hypothetical protein HJG60_010544 [Phyllostomus discolor]